MSRRFVVSLCLLCIAAWCAMTISCGSSNSSNNQQTCRLLYDVVGDWQINVSASNGSTTGYGAIDSNGLALFFDNSLLSGSGDTLELPTINGNCSFSGNTTIFAEPGEPVSPTSVTVPTQGNVTSNSNISGTFSGTTTGSFTATSFSPIPGSATALTELSFGTMQGAFPAGGISLLVTFSASGSDASMSFTGTGAACTVNGTFTQVSTRNVFDVSMNYSGASCPVTGTITGLGFESSSDYFNFNSGAAGTYLYADMLYSSGPFVMEFWP